MKLATLNNGSRDGRLLVVNRANLHKAVFADNVLHRLYRLPLDNWAEISPRLEEIYVSLNRGEGQSTRSG